LNDDGTARQERGLKHRADNETRTIPIPPELVRLLRAHIKKYGTTPDGRQAVRRVGARLPALAALLGPGSGLRHVRTLAALRQQVQKEFRWATRSARFVTMVPLAGKMITRLC
jgi:integrase